ATREIPTAGIEAAKRNKEGVRRNIAVAAKEAASTLPKVGNNHYVCLVIAGAGFQPCLPFAHVIGRAEVCVAIRASDLQATEFVDQEEVDDATHCVGAVHSRGAILQNVDVIDKNKWNKIYVHTCATASAAQSKRDAFAIY